MSEVQTLSGNTNTVIGDDYKKIEFSGNAKEYFGIWIVNLILSIVTLGIYSAWAKVRRETYFNNNTKIQDTGFGYHATGGQILKGRLIAVAILVVYGAINIFEPTISVILLVAFFFLVPWLINASLRFSARMTSFRNVRFNWHGQYLGTFWFLLIGPVVGLLSLGLLAPLIAKSTYTYFATHHTYGATRFDTKLKVSGFYKAFLLGVPLPTVILTAILYGVFSQIMITDYVITYFPDLAILWFSSSGIVFLPVLALYALIYSMAAIYPILCRNLMVQNLTLTDVAKFDSKISPLKFVWISVSNVVVIIASLGLMLPWAQVRQYKYLANCTEIKITGDLNKFIDNAVSSQSAFGEELAELEGIEVGI